MLAKLVLLGICTLLLAACGEVRDAPKDPTQAPDDSYFLGESFAGHELEAVFPEFRSGNTFTSFIYGTCEVDGGLFSDGGCAPPLEVQSQSLCYQLPADRDLKNLVPFRGALALLPEPTVPEVRIYSRSHTIVVFAQTGRLARKAAMSVRRVSEPEPRRLRRPTGASLRGRGACRSRFSPG